MNFVNHGRLNLWRSFFVMTIMTCDQVNGSRTEKFVGEIRKNVVDVEKTKSSIVQSTVLHLSNRKIGVKEFYDLYSEINKPKQLEGVVSLINIRRFYKGSDEKESKISITDIFIAIEKYLKNTEKGFVHYKNLEITFFAMKHNHIADFDTAEKILENMENAYENINHLINDIVIENTYDAMKQKLADFLYNSMLPYIFCKITKTSSAVEKQQSIEDLIAQIFAEIPKHIADSGFRHSIHFLLDGLRDDQANLDRLLREAEIHKEDWKFLHADEDKDFLFNLIVTKYIGKFGAFVDVFMDHILIHTVEFFRKVDTYTFADACNNLREVVIECINKEPAKYELDDLDEDINTLLRRNAKSLFLDVYLDILRNLAITNT